MKASVFPRFLQVRRFFPAPRSCSASVPEPLKSFPVAKALVVAADLALALGLLKSFPVARALVVAVDLVAVSHLG